MGKISDYFKAKQQQDELMYRKIESHPVYGGGRLQKAMDAHALGTGVGAGLGGLAGLYALRRSGTLGRIAQGYRNNNSKLKGLRSSINSLMSSKDNLATIKALALTAGGGVAGGYAGTRSVYSPDEITALSKMVDKKASARVSNHFQKVAENGGVLSTVGNAYNSMQPGTRLAAGVGASVGGTAGLARGLTRGKGFLDTLANTAVGAGAGALIGGGGYKAKNALQTVLQNLANNHAEYDHYYY